MCLERTRFAVFFGAQDREARSLGSEDEPKVWEVQGWMFEIPRFDEKFKFDGWKFELPKPWNFEHRTLNFPNFRFIL